MSAGLNVLFCPPHIAGALERLERQGYEAWCVGGCVRDILLGRAPSDWDIATAAEPQEIKGCFPGLPTIDTGVRHGTVTLLFPEGPVEATTFRAEDGYSDARRPDRVWFSKSLGEDLSRRDFTINAMAYSPFRGFADPFGGREDLRKKLLRCVGDPEKRFSEDALRILRCLRFSAVLGFSVETSTAGAALEKRGTLARLSRERVLWELKKLLCGTGAAQVLGQYKEILFVLLPELSPMAACEQKNPYHCFDVWEHTLRVLEAVPPEFPLRMAALLHDCGKPRCKTAGENGIDHFYGHSKASEAIAAGVLRGLRCSTLETQEICRLVRFHSQELPFTPQRIKRLFNRFGEAFFFSLLSLMRADLRGQPSSLWEERSGQIAQAEAMAKEILEKAECFSLKDLVINGNDLLKLGFPKGKVLGGALESLLEQVIGGGVPNEREALLSQAARLLREKGEERRE